MRTDEEIKSIFRSGVQPLRCEAETWDYADKLRVRVFDDRDLPLLSFPRIALDQARGDGALASMIGNARERLEARGYGLSPWQFPKAPLSS